MIDIPPCLLATTMNKREDDSVDDAALFRAEMSGVKRLQAHHRAPESRLPSPRPLQKEADEQAVMRELLSGPEPEALESGDTLSYRSPGVQDSVLRKLRRGQFRIEKELDLHGLNRDKAREAVTRFLTHCLDHHLRCVRIIHGKGHGSPNSGPVIKSSLDGWLRRRREVVAFCSARPADGGTGAIYLLLRPSS